MLFILAAPLLVKADSYSDDPDAKQGFAQWKAGDLDAAIASFTKVIEKFPHDVVPLVRRGMVYHDNNDLDNAIADFTEVVEHHKGSASRALCISVPAVTTRKAISTKPWTMRTGLLARARTRKRIQRGAGPRLSLSAA